MMAENENNGKTAFYPLDPERMMSDLKALSLFNSTPGEGVTRLPFTKEAREACEYLKKKFSDAGLLVHEDAIGNIIGVLPGLDRSLPAIAMGSHYDTVYNGGMFDGQAGIISALEIVRCLREQGIRLRRDLIIIAFNDEEGVRFHRSYLGSYGILGRDQSRAILEYKDRDGISISEAMRSWGMDPEGIADAAWDFDRIRSFIELHIEQGPVLDKEDIDVGIVHSVVGFRRYMVTVKGREDHSGTTPMDLRSDAVDTAARVICWMTDFARMRNDGTVATAGYLKVKPSVENIVPGLCEFSAEVRSQDIESLDLFTEGLRESLDKAAALCGTEYEIIEKMDIPPVKLSDRLCEMLRQSCEERGFSYKLMPSGAGHDAQEIASACETVMIFCKSRDGRSHCREEWTDPGDMAKAAAAAYDLVMKLSDQE